MVELDLPGEEEWTQNSDRNSSDDDTVDPNSNSRVKSLEMLETPVHGAASKVQALFGKLQRLALKEEEVFYSLNLPALSTDGCVGVAERDSAVSTIKSMQRFYNFGSDTLASAVSYMDRFLSKVKVKTRYLSCVAAASFFLATKMHEESEHSPSATDLSSLNRRIWKASDLKRMEKVILEKLEWNLFPGANCLAFLSIIFDLLKFVNSAIDQRFFNTAEERLELYLNYARCSAYRASTLAVSTIHQCLKEGGLSCVASNYLLLHVQAVCKISDSELWDCQCALSRQLELYNLGSAARPRCLPLPKITPRPNLVIRPSFYGCTDLPTIHEVPWGGELREQSVTDLSIVPYSSNTALSYDPCLIQTDIPLPPRLCFITDQCYFGTVGAYYNQCNISM